jgi:hypothetical protein
MNFQKFLLLSFDCYHSKIPMEFNLYINICKGIFLPIISARHREKWHNLRNACLKLTQGANAVAVPNGKYPILCDMPIDRILLSRALQVADVTR